MSQCHSYLSLVESLEAVVDGEHFVTFGDSHSDGSAHGGVHPCSRSADVQHRHVKGALRKHTQSIKHTSEDAVTHTNTTHTQKYIKHIKEMAIY